MSRALDQKINQTFGTIITRLIKRENLTRQEAKQAFISILNNEITQMHQGAFLSALAAKGETKHEVAGLWEAIYELDTTKVNLNKGIHIADNCGTGMDTFKTFNISTAASIIAAAGGIPMARHGARAITSICGTVDIAEALGVNVECSADIVKKSIETSGIGLFNGMSPHIHPNALGRILSQINFGSTLNIAASLANPALPSIGVRGVYSKEMIEPIAHVMEEIGYKNAIVLHGCVGESDKGMDEASICGITHCMQISEKQGNRDFFIDPKKLGLAAKNYDDLVPEKDIQREAKRFAALFINGDRSVRKDAVILNAALIFLAADKAETIEEAIEKSAKLLESGTAFKTLEKWVQTQNTYPEKGLKQLHSLVQ
jgi:anthranilate phosphoribosyltransferase